MRLVLDTSALWDRPLIEALSAAHAIGLGDVGVLEATLPAVAHAERLRQLRGDGRALAPWRTTLRLAGIRVEPFREAEAERAAERAARSPAWPRHARDFLVAAHVHGDRLGVTGDAGPAWEDVRAVPPSAAAAAVRSLVGGSPTWSRRDADEAAGTDMPPRPDGGSWYATRPPPPAT